MLLQLQEIAWLLVCSCWEAVHWDLLALFSAPLFCQQKDSCLWAGVLNPLHEKV